REAQARHHRRAGRGGVEDRAPARRIGGAEAPRRGRPLPAKAGSAGQASRRDRRGAGHQARERGVLESGRREHRRHQDGRGAARRARPRPSLRRERGREPARRRRAPEQTGGEVMRRASVLLVLAVFALGGCASHHVGGTQVGVLVCKIALGCDSKGVQNEIYPPGSTNFFAPFVRDFYTLDKGTQTLEMTASPEKGDRKGADDL